MKHTIFFLLITLPLFRVNALHQSYTDSLVQALNTTENIADRIDILNELAWEWREEKMDVALQYSDSAYHLSQQINDTERQTTSLKRKGVVLKNKGDYSTALYCYEEALAYEIASNNKKGEASCYNNMGNIYKKWGDNKPALECFIKSLKIKENLFPGSITLANTYKNLGYFYFTSLEKLDTAIFYLEQAKEIAVEKKNAALEGLIINDLGLIYHESEMFENAFSFFREAASKFETLDDSVNMARVWDNLGRTATYMEDYPLAELYHYQSLSVKKAHHDQIGEGIVYCNLGDLMLKKENYADALDYYNKFLKISEKSDSKQNIVTAYQGLSLSYEGLKQYEEAIVFRKAYEEAKSEMDLRNNKEEVEELRIRYNTEKRKQQITTLQLEKELHVQALERSNQFNNALMLISGLVLLVAFLIVRNYQAKRKASQYLAIKIEEINNQRVNEIMQLQELKIMEAVIDSQEYERKRIAQQLHGEVGSILHTIKLYFNSMEKKFNSSINESKEQYLKANELLDKVTCEIRDVSHSLDAGIVNNLGIIAALEELAESIQLSNQMYVTVESYNMEERLESRKEILIYRIIQEVVSNVLKHAKANNLYISLTRREHDLNIIIEDDGIGFDVEQARKSGGMGLKNISTKVSHLGGDLVFDSKKGHGSTVIIDINL
ncbi:MAG: hypothetical protein CMO01_18515 [Thalassobius sp.]|nr:hypothetical protein [Thalassovita sp.]